MFEFSRNFSIFIFLRTTRIDYDDNTSVYVSNLLEDNFTLNFVKFQYKMHVYDFNIGKKRILLRKNIPNNVQKFTFS